jgi:hypothetical protein
MSCAGNGYGSFLLQKMKSSLQMLVMYNFIIPQNSIRQKSLLPEAATEPRCENQVTHNLKKIWQ